MKTLFYLNILISVIINFLISGGYSGSLTVITEFILLPLSLFILNLMFLFFKSDISIPKCSFFMLIGLLSGDLVGYILWGLSSKRLFKPDPGTIWFMKKLFAYHFYSVLLSFLILIIVKFFILVFKKK